MTLVEKYDKLSTDLKESQVVSDLMIDFPLISKQDNLEVLVSYVTLHYEKTSEIINYNSIPETQGGSPLRIASKKRKSKKATSEAVEESKPKPKKKKKVKTTPQLNIIEPALPTIQEEVADLKPVEVLKTRTGGGTSVAAPTQSKPKNEKKKRSIRKMKVSKYVEEEDADVEETLSLVTRVKKGKKDAVDSSKYLIADQEAVLVEQAVKVASQVDIPTASLVKEIAVEDATKVVVLIEEIKGLAYEESGNLVKANMEVKREKACSEAAISEAATSDAAEIRGNSSIHSIYDNVMNLDFTSNSLSTSTSTSLDEISLTIIYENLEKDLAPSSSTKTTKKPNDIDGSEALSIDERLDYLVQRRIDSCKNLPADHPLQPAFLKPLQTVLLDEKFEGETA